MYTYVYIHLHVYVYVYACRRNSAHMYNVFMCVEYQPEVGNIYVHTHAEFTYTARVAVFYVWHLNICCGFPLVEIMTDAFATAGNRQPNKVLVDSCLYSFYAALCDKDGFINHDIALYAPANVSN